MEKSFVFNSVNGDRKYKSEDFREYFATFIGNGVFPNPSTNLQVIANNNMTVTLKKGPGWINGAVYVNTDDYILNVDVADGILNRIDRVVLRMDTVLRKIYAYVKKGQLASYPNPQILQRDADAYEIALADIYVTKGTVSITQSNITDLRLNKDLCGIVHGTVDQVDTTAVFNQFQSWYSQTKQAYDNDIAKWTKDKKDMFNNWYKQNTQVFLDQFNKWYGDNTSNWSKEFSTWFQNIKNTLDGDVAGNLLNKINDIPKILEGNTEPQGIRAGDFWLKEV